MKITMNNNNKTFNDGFEQFILEHITMNNLRPSTEKHYRDIIKYSWYKYYDGNNKLCDMTQDDIDGYTIYMKENNTKDTTININLKAMKTIIKFFTNKGYIDNINVSLIKADIDVIEAYSDEEISRLLVKPNIRKCSFATYRNWVIVNFLCNTGCRRSTLINIHIEDLDLDNGFCQYRHTKNRKKQTVPITPTMCDILREYISYLPNDCEYLFPNVLGNKMMARSLSHAMDDYNDSRGVYRHGIHKFRHWFAKKSVMCGMDLIRLQKILGHSNLDMLRRYVNILTQDLKYNEIATNPLENIMRSKSKRIKM